MSEYKELVIEALLPLKEFFEKHTSLVVIISSIIPFIISYLSMIFFTHGDLKTAVYLIQEIGLPNVWISGLFVTLTSFITALVVWTLDFSFTTDPSRWTWSLSLYLIPVFAFAFILLSPILVVTYIIGAFAITRHHKIKKTYKSKEQKIKFLRLYSIFLLSGFIYFGIITYPNLPVTQLHYMDGRVEQTLLLSESNEYYIVKNLDSGKLVEIPRDEVKSRNICSKDGYNILTSQIATNFRKGKILDTCEN